MLHTYTKVDIINEAYMLLNNNNFFIIDSILCNIGFFISIKQL